MKKNKIRGCEEQPLLSMESKFPELKMSRIKSIIQKLFPPKQKTFNIFIAVYLALFVISLPEIFVYHHGELATGFQITIAWLASWPIFIVFMLALPMYYKSRKRNAVFIPLLAFLIYLYFIAIRMHKYTAGLLDPIFFLPALITFILWNKISAKPVRNLIIFLAIPFSLVAFDKIVTLGFQLSCPFTTPEAEYNPIYLPKRFFHEENGKLVPNIQEINRISSFHDLPDVHREHSILVYDMCGWVKEKIAKELLRKGNVILCKVRKSNLDIPDYLKPKKYLNPLSLSIVMVDDKGTKTTIAKLYSKLFIKGYENGWLRNPSLSYCGYGNIFMTNKAQFKNEYEKYIKLSNDEKNLEIENKQD